MSDRALECPKCGRPMEAGFLLDQTQGGFRQSAWVEGQPEPSFWTGLKLGGHEQRAVTTYRCSGCGFLESYAR